jgi:hypothetical protein
MIPGKSRLGNPSSVIWNQGGPSITPVPSSSSVPGTPGVSGQSRMMNAGHGYGVSPDSNVFPIPPARAVSLSSPMEIPSQYPGHFQSISPDYKRRMTSPSQNIGQIHGPVIHSPNSPIAEMQGANLPVSYGGHSAPMNFHSWDSLHNLPGASGVDAESYPMFSTEHLPVEFHGQHMVPPDANRSPGL